MEDFKEFIETLVALGEEEVRKKLSQGVWANRRKGWAEDWLRNLELSRKEDRGERALTLSEEANGIARSALDVAKKAKTISVIAIIVSVLVAIVSIIYSNHRQ